MNIHSEKDDQELFSDMYEYYTNLEKKIVGNRIVLDMLERVPGEYK